MIKVINGFATQSWFYEQLKALADGGAARPGLGVLTALVAAQRREGRAIKALAA